MKKIIILSMILILGLSLMAYAASMKLDFVFGPFPDNTGIAEGCFAIVNYTPKDAANVDNENDVVATIQIQVRGLDPETEYEVFSNYEPLGTFTTNKKGSGGFHCNVYDTTFEEEEPRYIGIWDESTTPHTSILWLEIVEF